MNKSLVIRCEGIEYHHRIDTGLAEKLNIRHCHDTYEILFVQEGEGRYLIEGTEITMKPRTLVIFKPLEYHCVRIEPDCNYDRYVLRFSESSLSTDARLLLSEIFSGDNGGGRFYSPDALSQTSVSVFDRMEYAINLPERERPMYMRLLLSELFVLLSGTGSAGIAHGEGELGARVAKYINGSLEMEISLDKLAKSFFVSKYYLCRSFKKYSGVSIHAYVTHKRVMFAKQLIDSGETASGAAYRVGFGDYSAFYRAYVKILGKPPTSKVKKEKS